MGKSVKTKKVPSLGTKTLLVGIWYKVSGAQRACKE